VLPVFGEYAGGGDLVETALLVQGLLAAGQYFSGDNETERRLVRLITELWKGVEWDWYRTGRVVLQGWASQSEEAIRYGLGPGESRRLRGIR
jgi:hypothetical protein